MVTIVIFTWNDCGWCVRFEAGQPSMKDKLVNYLFDNLDDVRILSYKTLSRVPDDPSRIIQYTRNKETKDLKEIKASNVNFELDKVLNNSKIIRGYPTFMLISNSGEIILHELAVNDQNDWPKIVTLAKANNKKNGKRTEVVDFEAFGNEMDGFVRITRNGVPIETKVNEIEMKQTNGNGGSFDGLSNGRNEVGRNEVGRNGRNRVVRNSTQRRFYPISSAIR